jgi:hypothetical protein
VDVVVQSLDYFLNAQLCPIEEQRYKYAIINRYLGSTTFRPQMPIYYLKSSNAHVQLETVQNCGDSLMPWRGCIHIRSLHMGCNFGRGCQFQRLTKLCNYLEGALNSASQYFESFCKEIQYHVIYELTIFSAKRKKRSNVLDSAMVQKAEEWWLNKTRVSPNCKDVIKNQIGEEFLQIASSSSPPRNLVICSNPSLYHLDLSSFVHG